MNPVRVLGWLSVVLILGCSLAPRVEIHIQVPPLPAVWETYPEAPRYTLSYYAPGFRRVEIDIPPSARTVSVIMGKGNNQPVLLTPSFQEQGYSLRPAGGLFPLHCADANRLSVSWEGGFLADLLFALENTAVPKQHLNTERMAAVIEETAAEDPWGLDRDRMVQALRFHGFRKDQVSPLPIYSVDVSLKKGRYLWSNPFVVPFEAWRDGTHTLQNLYPGEHVLFPVNGGQPVRIIITRDRWFIFYGESVEFGSWSVSGTPVRLLKSHLPGGRLRHLFHTARVPG